MARQISLGAEALNTSFAILAVLLVTVGAVVSVIAALPSLDDHPWGRFVRLLGLGLSNVGAVFAVAVLYADAARARDSALGEALGDAFAWLIGLFVLAGLIAALSALRAHRRPRATLTGERWAPAVVHAGGTGGWAYYASYVCSRTGVEQTCPVIGFAWDDSLRAGHALVIAASGDGVCRAIASADALGEAGWRFQHLGLTEAARCDE